MDCAPRRRLLIQAPVRPLDPDGVNVAIFGVAGFAAASVFLALRWPQLVADQVQWWLWVALSGTELGLIGLGYCVWRKWSRRSRSAMAGGDDAQPAVDSEAPAS